MSIMSAMSMNFTLSLLLNFENKKLGGNRIFGHCGHNGRASTDLGMDQARLYRFLTVAF